MNSDYKVLLIEDNEDDAELIKVELEKNALSLKVDHITDIDTFEHYFEKNIPDLVISDYNLPGTTGLENLERVKKQNSDLPFILISGFIEEDLAIEAMVAGASDYIMKDNLLRLNPAVQREILAFEEILYKKRLLEEAYALADIGHWELDLKLEILSWSDKIYEIHEVSKDFIPDLESAISFYKEGTSQDKITRLVNAAIQDGTSFTSDFEIITAKGNERWVRVFLDTHVHEGKTVRLYGSTQDITSKKVADKKLLDTEQQLRNIVEQSTNLFYRHDLEHNLTYLSPQAEYYLGCDPEEAKTRWTEFVSDHPNNKIGFEHTQRAINTGETQPPFELQLKRKDGQLLWVFVNEVPIFKNGKVVGISGSLTDITLLKRIQERDKMLSMVASETHNMVVITDKEQRIEWVNKAYTEVTGYSLEEVIGKNPGTLLQGEQTDQGTVSRIAKKMAQNETFTETILNYTKNGEPYWTKISISPILNDDGVPVKYFSIQEDITEQKKDQEKITLQKELLEEAQRVGKIGHWSYIPDTDEIFWSHNMYNIYELDPQSGPPSYNEIMGMYEEEDFHRKVVEKALKEGTPYSFDIKLRTGKGHYKYLHIEGLVDVEPSGKVKRIHGISMDVTERKIAELELQDRQNELQRITNNIGGLFQKYVLNPDGTDEILYISDGVKVIHEIDPEDAKASPNLLWEQTLPEDLESLKKSVYESAENMNIWDHKWQIKTPSGKTKWVHGRGMPYKGTDGSTIWDTLVIDITQAELAKVEREEFHNIVENNTSEIYIMDIDSLEILYANNVATENLGYKLDELIGMDPTQLNAEYVERPDHINYLLDELRSDKEKSVTFETVHKRKDNSHYHAQVQMSKSTYKGQEVLIGFVLDITEQKKAEVRLLTLLDTAPIAIYIQNYDDHVVDLWNKASEQMLGFTSSEVMGKALPAIHNETLRDYRNAVEQAKKGQTIHGKEIIKQRKDGTYFQARMNAVSLVTDDELDDSILIMLEDITDEKELENTLKTQLSFNSSILDSLPGLFYMVDENLNFTRVNRSFLDFFNLEESDLNELDVFELIYPEDHELIFENKAKLFSNGFAETRIRVTSGGEVYYFYLNAKLITLGDQTFIIGNGINIDTQIKAEQHNEVLLQEVHHRVKNNLAIISGLLWLEMNDLQEDRAILPLQRSINRIHSMAKVHELLYDTSNLATISISRYLTDLSNIIKDTFSVGDDIRIIAEVENLDMSVNEAVPLGMLFNELMSNSIKYAFNDAGGNINISISKSNNVYTVKYSDDGPGFKENLNLQKANTLGMNIIKTLLNQLKAEYTLETKGRFELSFTFEQKTKGSHSNI